MVFEAGYMGNRSSRILMVQPVNDAAFALPNDTSAPQTRRRVTTLLGAINYLTPSGYSNYNAMTLSLDKRFSQGLSLVGSFTWSRALGMAPAITEGINGSAIQDPTNLAREYGPLEFDIVRRFVASYLYELPFGKGKHFLGQYFPRHGSDCGRMAGERHHDIPGGLAAYAKSVLLARKDRYSPAVRM